MQKEYDFTIFLTKAGLKIIAFIGFESTPFCVSIAMRYGLYLLFFVAMFRTLDHTADI
jgi:hypothetical protein